MIKIPRIALFTPEAHEAAQLQPIFKQHEFGLRNVRSVDEVLELIEDEGDTFDAIVVPLTIKGAKSGAALCAELKSIPKLWGLPLVGVVFSKEINVIENFYQMGADLVLSAPLDPQSLHLLLGSLGRMRRVIHKRLDELHLANEGSERLFELLDFTSEALLVFDLDQQPLYANTAARVLLALQDPPDEGQITVLSDLFNPSMELHKREHIKGKLQAAQQEYSASRELKLTSFDGQILNLRLKISSIIGKREEILFFVVHLSESSQFDDLSAHVLQSMRTRSLCLYSASTSMRMIEAAYLGSGASILKATNDFIDGLPVQCAINSCVTHMLEYLDLVISPSISVRVRIKEDINLAMRQTDFTQLLGHLIMHAAEFIGERGELSVESDKNIPGQGVTIVVAASARKDSPRLKDIELAKVLSGEFSGRSRTTNAKGKILPALMAAQEIAERYRTEIEYKITSEMEVKLRVRLPVYRERQQGGDGKESA